MRAVTAREISEIDRRAEEEFHIPQALLMENAGRHVASVARLVAPPDGQHVVVAAGKGNNGGDGLVAARLLAAEGWTVKVLLLAREEEVTGEPRRNMELARQAGVEVIPVNSMALSGARGLLAAADVIIDAIFGTGFRGSPVGLAAQVIQAANDSPARIVAVDLPSGVEGDTGAVRGVAIAATATVTMGLPKIGILVYPGAARAGRLYVADLGYPRALLDDPDLRVHVVMPPMAARALPPRAPDSHKGRYGRVLIYAGSRGLTGAPSLCALGALRMGAGLVSLGVPAGVYPIVAAREWEAMPHPLPDADGMLNEDAWEASADLVSAATVIAAGPGLGRGAGVGAFVRRLLAEGPAPLVLDADALNALADGPDALGRSHTPRVLTPHPGEMARLLGAEAAAVQQDRPGAARDAARRFGAVVVLKGARTVVAAPDGETYLVPTGNPGMASGGMGDVLTGAVAGLIAQGVHPFTAAWLGAYLHGLAGDLVAERQGEAGLLAREVADALPQARRTVLADPARGPIHVLERP